MDQSQGLAGHLTFPGDVSAFPSRDAILEVERVTDEEIVVVLSRGGARFQVPPLEERIFSARASDTAVTVLGTEFEMLREEPYLRVAVYSGVVAVESGASRVILRARVPLFSEILIFGAAIA